MSLSSWCSFISLIQMKHEVGDSGPCLNIGSFAALSCMLGANPFVLSTQRESSPMDGTRVQIHAAWTEDHEFTCTSLSPFQVLNFAASQSAEIKTN